MGTYGPTGLTIFPKSINPTTGNSLLVAPKGDVENHPRGHNIRIDPWYGSKQDNYLFESLRDTIFCVVYS